MISYFGQLYFYAFQFILAIFHFSFTLGDYERDIIRRAFSHWEQQTCLGFDELNESDSIAYKHLYVTNRGS